MEHRVLTDGELDALWSEDPDAWALAAPETVRAHKPAPAATGEFITRATFAGVLAATGKAIRGAIDRALDPLGTRVSNLEFKCGALAMTVAGSEDQRERRHLQRIESLEARIRTLENK